MDSSTNLHIFYKQYQMLNLLCKLIEKTTRLRFIPAITGRYICSMNEGKLLVLTLKFGGFGPFNNCETQNIEYRKPQQK